MLLVINQNAVGDENKKVFFDGYAVEDGDKGTKPNAICVDMIKLSDYIKKTNKSLDLVKIDTEGYEYKILKDIYFILRDNKPNLIVEVLTDEEADKINDLIKDLGYHYFLIDDFRNEIIRSKTIVKPPKYNIAIINNDSVENFEEEFKSYIIN
jgi:hypothetical protein